VNAEAGPIESASIAAPATAANEQPANLVDSIVFSFVFPKREGEEHGADERNMKRQTRARCLR
jgi:hypothetical protein